MDSILDDKTETRELDNDHIVSELTSAIETLKLISTKEKRTKFVAKEVEKLNSSLNSEKPIPKEVSLNEQIPEYEVFEAYIEEDEKIDRYVNDIEENICKKNRYPETLYGELKEALNVKAKSHRTREAKALGIDENSIELPNSNPEIQRLSVLQFFNVRLPNQYFLTDQIIKKNIITY